MRELRFEHRGLPHLLEIDDYDDVESSDTVTIFGPDGNQISSYDSCAHTDAQFIAEAINELRCGT
ncbi:MAG: hypothetical protein WAV90_19280 [Gordonia amarae]